MKKRLPDREITVLLSAGKIKAILCDPNKNKKQYNAFNADVILFDDGKTFISLDEQDYYSYHDCSSSARHLDVVVDKDQWNMYLRDYVPALRLT